MTAATTVADPGRRGRTRSSFPAASRGRPEHSGPTARRRPTQRPARRRRGSAATAANDAAIDREWRLRLPGGRELVLGRGVQVMGILNLTPDSFSDGGLHQDPDRAAHHALEMLEQGAHLIDLGAESTRPGGGSVYGAGAVAVPADEELRRLLPVLRRLRPQTRAPLSIDTRKAEVARAALDEGADLVNDVSALADAGMAPLIADRGVPVVLMHSRGDLASMQRDIRFEDVVAEVSDELAGALRVAAAAGIALEQTIVDPGIGFGKTAAQNLALLARLDALADLGRPVLVGASRKSFLGQVGRERGGPATPPSARLAGSLAAAGWACRGGAQIVRVHDVAQTVQFLEVWNAIGAVAATLDGARSEP